MELVLFCTIIIGAFSLIFTIGFISSQDERQYCILTLIGWIPFTILLIWLVCSSIQPTEILYEQNCNIINVESNELKLKKQSITWQDPKGQICGLDVTAYFGYILDEQTHNIHVIMYKQGPYFGLYYKIPPQYIIMMKE